MNLRAARRKKISLKELNKITCYNYFPKIFIKTFFGIKIYLSFESKSSSVFQLDIEWYSKLLVLKHMEDPVDSDSM